MFYVVYSDELLMVRHRACRKEEVKHVVMGTALTAHRDCRLGFGRIENAAAFIYDESWHNNVKGAICGS